MAGEAAAPAPSEIKFTLRSCCFDAPAGAGFVELKGAPGPLSMSDAPIVEPDHFRADYEVDRPTAFHEAGHALAAIVAGGSVRRIALRDPNPNAQCRDIPLEAQPVFALAGPHAENLARGWIMPLPQDLVTDHLAIVAAPAGGNCDFCLALRPCVARAGLDNRDDALRLFRCAERAVVDLIEHEHARRFLRSTAHELLREGELPGERVHQIYRLVIDPEAHETLKNIVKQET
ncbi:MAG: hypothetical protein INF18_04975 [Methylobacterium sp.]|nr:hypothetical protein [Methylobacterium sp.]MCA3637809.1 hypothetical protein [Methylobacterium sp.]